MAEEKNLKYEYVDGENSAPYKSKSKRKKPKKSKHKHQYTNILIEHYYPENYYFSQLAGTKGIIFASYCPICGKVNSPIIDDKIKENFPNLCYLSDLLIFFRVKTWGEEKELRSQFKKWYEQNYPKYSISDYFDMYSGGQKFIELDKIILPVV